MKAVSIIITREYLERVKRKSFIITTLLMPLLMLALMAAPTLIMLFSSPEQRNIAVIDDSGVIASQLQSSEELKFIVTDGSLDSLRADESIDGILVLNKGIVEERNPTVSFYSRGASSIMAEGLMKSQIEDAIEAQRIKAYEIDNLRQILDEVNADVSLTTVRIDKDEEAETSSILAYVLGLIMDMFLYMFILIYGQMVMTSIIEEKNNRVLEIVVSSVNPTSLMLGKIIGIGLVAITQIMIWGVIIGAASAWLIPFMGGSSGSTVADPELAEMAGAISQLSQPGWMLGLFGWLLLFFIGGYLFYSAIWAAIGSSVDNIQDASQLSSIATIPVIIGIIVSMAVIQDPASNVAVWVSMIPFTSPMAMMSRLPFGIPIWQILTSLAILYASFFGLIWVAAKIYRVGIFMYGKKPTLADLIRWARYK